MSVALDREGAAEPTKPVVLAIVEWGSLMGGAICLLLLVPLLRVAVDADTYVPLGDEEVPATLLVQQARWVLGLGGTLMLVVGVGLRRRTRWVRPLIVLHWLPALVPLALLEGVGVADVVATVALTALGMAASVWYFYRRPNVRAWFESHRLLHTRRDSARPVGHSGVGRG